MGNGSQEGGGVCGECRGPRLLGKEGHPWQRGSEHAQHRAAGETETRRQAGTRHKEVMGARTWAQGCTGPGEGRRCCVDLGETENLVSLTEGFTCVYVCVVCA